MSTKNTRPRYHQRESCLLSSRRTKRTPEYAADAQVERGKSWLYFKITSHINIKCFTTISRELNEHSIFLELPLKSGFKMFTLSGRFSQNLSPYLVSRTGFGIH